MTAAQDIIKDINDNTLDSSRLLDSAEQRIYEIRQGREVTGLTPVSYTHLQKSKIFGCTPYSCGTQRKYSLGARIFFDRGAITPVSYTHLERISEFLKETAD